MLGIAVPSRRSHNASDLRPLAGLRISVKDIFALAGIKTSLCNRAFHDLYPAEVKSAAAVAKLLSLGATVVGKTDMVSFALQEHPTQCIDYQMAFNPRADGYQIPGGSSSGGAAAIAAYDWLDLSVVTDS